MVEPTPVRWNVCPDCLGRHPDGAACHDEQPRPDAPRIVVHESDACQGNITGWDCEDCEDDACEHECHQDEPSSDLCERLTEALRAHHVGDQAGVCVCGAETGGPDTWSWDAHLAAALLPVVEEALAEQRRRLRAVPEEHRCESVHPDRDLRCTRASDHVAHVNGGDGWSCACDLNTERAEQAERELAALHDGETEPPSGRPAPTYTPSEWLHWFNHASPQERLDTIERIYQASGWMVTCIMNHHEERLKRSEGAVERVKTALPHLQLAAHRIAATDADRAIREFAARVLANLDADQPKEETAHAGNGNAEDCPVCRPLIDQPGGVLYPWLCTAADQPKETR